MKIDYPKASGCLAFADVFIGDVFKFKDEYFIKISLKGKTQALNLKNYSTHDMQADDKVEPYFASRLVIKK